MLLAGKQVLVTGATGFVGGTLASRLAAGGAQVRALARSPEKAAFLRGKESIEIIQGDITDADRMHAVTRGCDFVFHVAGAMRGDLALMRSINVDGTRNVVEAAATAKVKRLVHVSTNSVYGYGNKGDITEDMGPTPGRDAYARTKSEGEAVVREVAEAGGLSYSIIRPGNMYGPRSNMWTAGMFKLARLKPTVYLGDGGGTIPIIYIDDVVDMMVELATHPAADGEAFNATPDPSPTWREFIGGYSKLAGYQKWLGIPLWPVKLIANTVAALAPSRSAAKELPGMLAYSTSANVTYKMTKAKEMLEWEPVVDLETGIEKCEPWLWEHGLLR